MKATKLFNDIKKKNMNTVHVCDSLLPVLYGLNFSKKEFFSPPIAPANNDFELYACIPQALQIFRNFFSKLYQKEIRWLITSTYRPFDPINMPPAHKIPPPAVDSVALDKSLRVEILDRIRFELKRWEHSDLIQDVLKTGTNIIIIENVCLHIHYRNSNLDYPTRFPSGIYLGEWRLSKTNPFGENIAYSH